MSEEKVKLTLEERVKRIETLLDGDDIAEESNWSYREIREILDRTDLSPTMNNQELQNVGASYDRIEKLLDDLGKTDAHVGQKTLKNRLDIIEGGIQILEGSHLGHNNSDAGEFASMHGFLPTSLKGDIMERIAGMQKKLDKIVKFLEKFEVKMSVKDALEL